MSRLLVIGSMHCPTVPGHIHTSSTSIYHWLNTYSHSVYEMRSVTLTSIIRNPRILVHTLSDSVAFQLAYYGKTERLSVRLYRVSNIAHPVAINSLLYSFVQGCLSYIQEFTGLLIHFPNRESISRVTVVSFI